MPTTVTMMLLNTNSRGRAGPVCRFTSPDSANLTAYHPPWNMLEARSHNSVICLPFSEDIKQAFFCTLEISMHLFNKSGCGKKSHHIVLRSFCQISASLPVPHKVNTLSLQLNYLAINRKPTATFFRLLFQLILVSDNLVVSEAPCLPLCG